MKDYSTLESNLESEQTDFCEDCHQINLIDNQLETLIQTQAIAKNRLTTVRQAPGCSTSVLRGLDQQLIDQINSIAPNSLVSFADLNVANGPAVHPFLQAAAKQSLARAIKARGRTLSVNSGYRTIAQQLMLFNHGKVRRCGIGVVAPPGRSNHQSGLALDINDEQGWRPYLEREGWRWFGPADRPHFDYIGRGTRNIRPLAVKAFQRLWNQYNPDKPIAEDGIYGRNTEARLNQAPIVGFGETNESLPERRLSLTKPYLEGDDVRELQEALVKATITVEVDGVFGPATKEAVKEFQKLKDLTVDGIVGAATRSALGL
ncbi:peptidoglycan-binding protein [Moorena sp. SIO2C4]|uniref:peptidoglycan-binding protein n=1 Tax=Moorena sp. SIO2C4 TaxID=2607824 RepID=UPI00257F316E|nr:peptidoglycan-binding protein [Moorena sp. SIO2C4]